MVEKVNGVVILVVALTLSLAIYLCASKTEVRRLERRVEELENRLNKEGSDARAK